MNVAIFARLLIRTVPKVPFPNDDAMRLLAVIKFPRVLAGKGCFSFKVGKTWKAIVSLDYMLSSVG